MRKLTIRKALKTPNIKFKTTKEQCKIIADILEEQCKSIADILDGDNYLNNYAIVIYTDGIDNIPTYYDNQDIRDFDNNSFEEIELINEEEHNIMNNNDQVTIIPQDGFEIDLDNSSLEHGIIKFKPIKKKEINKWEDLEEIIGCYIDGFSDVENVNEYDTERGNKNIFKTKPQAESCLAFSMYSQLKEHNSTYEVLCEYLDESKPMLEILFGELTDQIIALVKLIKLRDIANGDWDIINSRKDVIIVENNIFKCYRYDVTVRTLSFKTREIAKKFLNDNIELLEIAKYLI